MDGHIRGDELGPDTFWNIAVVGDQCASSGSLGQGDDDILLATEQIVNLALLCLDDDCLSVLFEPGAWAGWKDGRDMGMGRQIGLTSDLVLEGLAVSWEVVHPHDRSGSLNSIIHEVKIG